MSKLVVAFLLVAITAVSASAEVPLAKDETLWKNTDLDSAVVNPVDWNGVQLVIVQTKQPDGKVGGVLRAIKDGKSTDVVKWEVSTATSQVASVHVRNGKAAFEFGRSLDLNTKDMGADTYIELVQKKGKVTTGKKWSGDRTSKVPSWAKAINPPI